MDFRALIKPPYRVRKHQTCQRIFSKRYSQLKQAQVRANGARRARLNDEKLSKNSSPPGVFLNRVFLKKVGLSQELSQGYLFLSEQEIWFQQPEALKLGGKQAEEMIEIIRDSGMSAILWIMKCKGRISFQSETPGR